MVSHPLVDSAAQQQPWALGPGVGGSQPSAKWPSSLHAPCASGQERGQNCCFLSSSRCSREAPASSDEMARPCVCLLSHEQGMGHKQGGFTCWMPGECSAWGSGGSCSSPALCRGSSLSSNHSLGQGNAFFQLSILLSIHC